MPHVVCLVDVEPDRVVFTWSEGPAAFKPFALVVQRKELSGIPQPLFSGLRVAHGGDAVPPLAPFGQLDRVSFGPVGSRGGEDDLQ